MPERSRRSHAPAFDDDDRQARDFQGVSWSSCPSLVDCAVRSTSRQPPATGRSSYACFDRPRLIIDDTDTDRDDLGPLNENPFGRFDADDMLDDQFDYNGPPPNSSASQTSSVYFYDAHTLPAD